MGDFDDEDGGEWLPRQLRDGSNGPNLRILIAGEVGVFLQSKDGAVAKYRFVEDLKEVDPDENNEDDSISLSADSFVLENVSGRIEVVEQ